MPGYLTTAAKATSTFCLLWSAYLIARSRSHRKNLRGSIPEINDTSAIDAKDVDPFKAYPMDSVDPVSTFQHPAGMSECPKPEDPGTGVRFLLHQSWSLVAQFLRNRLGESGRSSQLYTSIPTVSAEQLSFYLIYIAQVAEKANLSPEVLSYGKKARLLGSNQSIEVLMKSLLDDLVVYTKSDEFVNLLLCDVEFPSLLHFLVQLALASYHPSPPPRDASRSSNGSRVLDLLDQTPVDATVWPSTLIATSVTNPAPNTAKPERTPLADVLQTTDPHPEYPVHLLVANILANVSRNVSDNHVLRNEEVENLLNTWCNSPSLHLLLLGEKIRYNLHSSQANETRTTSSTNLNDTSSYFRPVYYPDIFRLDKQDQLSSLDTLKEDYDVDIIFVHGMRGSVFYTWRQNEAMVEVTETENPTYSKCWPRDWLSRDFPKARILGIDTSLSPFIWNPICPIDRLKRTLDTRAKTLLPQLEAAGVGQRPIVWVTHSAGGILVKELIRLSKRGNQTASEPDSSTIGHNIQSQSSQEAVRIPSALDRLDHHHTNPDPFVARTTPLTRADSPPRDAGRPKWYCDPVDGDDTRSMQLRYEELADLPPDLSAASATSSPQRTRRRFNTVSEGLQFALTNPVQLVPGADHTVSVHNLADSTRGVVFMSAPHRGNQSLFALYRRPLRWTLTPEAIQLERNSAYLLDLHSWFNLWALRDHVRILTMVEQRLTPVNRFWSVLLVPEDKRDREMGEVVYIDSDHMYISKPRRPSDPTYVNIVNFIRQTVPNDNDSHFESGSETIQAK